VSAAEVLAAAKPNHIAIIEGVTELDIAAGSELALRAVQKFGTSRYLGLLPRH